MAEDGCRVAESDSKNRSVLFCVPLTVLVSHAQAFRLTPKSGGLFA
jgi:hypothetical protein